MPDFTVDRVELETAATGFGTLVTKAEGIKTAIANVNLHESDFGRVPWLQSRVWEAYRDHTTDCQASVEELRGALENVQAGLTSSAAAYRIIDDAAEQASLRIMTDLEVGPK